MKGLPKSQILGFTEKAINLARRAVPLYSSKFSKQRYTLPQHVVLLCLKVRCSRSINTENRYDVLILRRFEPPGLIMLGNVNNIIMKWLL